MNRAGAQLQRRLVAAIAAATVIGAGSLGLSIFLFAKNTDLEKQLSSLVGTGVVCGIDGQDGATGSCGPAGPCGPAGEPGEDGATGTCGPEGPCGPQGEKGDTGATGATGATGEQGEQGITGEVGPQGATGTAGRDGVDGITTLGYHGAFFDTTDQRMSASSTGQAMRLDSADPSNCGVYVVSSTSSRIYVQNAGVYNLQFSAQLKTDSNQIKPIDIWLAKNGQAVEFTNTQFFAPDRKGIYVAAWNFVIPLSAGDYVELMWYTADSTAYISQLPAQTYPPIPAVPSLIATLTQVG